MDMNLKYDVINGNARKDRDAKINGQKCLTIKKANATIKKGSEFVDKMRERKKGQKNGVEIMTIGGDEIGKVASEKKGKRHRRELKRFN